MYRVIFLHGIMKDEKRCSMYIKDVFHSNTGISQFRLEESNSDKAVLYTLYGQNELSKDLFRGPEYVVECKQIKLLRTNSTLHEGDLVFSTISGEATVVGANHEGYILTQNYVRMVPVSQNVVDTKYIAFLINESPEIKRYFRQNLQGSQVVRYSLNLLKKAPLPPLPSIEKQRIIGDIYYKQLKLQALQQRVAINQGTIKMAMLRGVN